MDTNAKPDACTRILAHRNRPDPSSQRDPVQVTASNGVAAAHGTIATHGTAAAHPLRPSRGLLCKRADFQQKWVGDFPRSRFYMFEPRGGAD